MKLHFIASLVLAASIFAACDDTTNDIGSSLTPESDYLSISTDTFEITSQSLVADSVLSKNSTGYLGKIKDPETLTDITCHFMTQFHTLENFSFPETATIMSRQGGEIIADSCKLLLYYDRFFGDSLASMKLSMYEMDKPMTEEQSYYSNFDPKDNGYIRTNGLRKDRIYTLSDETISEAEKSNSNYRPYIQINLNDPYTDKNGVTYNNYGTYLMKSYYAHPEYFRNYLKLANNVMPGFYFKSVAGLGAMAYIDATQLFVYYRIKDGDSTIVVQNHFAGTEEVLQTTTIVNDVNSIRSLAADQTCTYIKSPAGIFTEITLPVDDIIKGHESDSINNATLVLNRINNKTQSKYALDIPATLLMVPKDSIYSFFEKNELVNYRTSFDADFNKTTNTYTFTNIANMLSYMKNLKTKGKDWNKVVLIPVSITKNSNGEKIKVVHDMSMTSTKLAGGPANANQPIRLSVIYTKFNQ